MENKIFEVLKSKKIGVLMGGFSAERDISLKTGEAIYNTLEKRGLKVIAIDVDENIAEVLKKEGIEIAFITLHGCYGEDGTIQGMLDIMDIPYTGSGVLASALAINKIISKEIFTYHGIPTPEFTIINRGNLNKETVNTQLKKIGLYPIVVKPSSEGSTIGISLVREEEDMDEALLKAFEFDEQVLIERYIDGRDVTVGILGDLLLPIVEIVSPTGFYDYQAKYTTDLTKYIVPADLSQELYKKVQDIALQAYTVLGCEGVARVDFRIDKKDKPYVLEVNTIPGMTTTSLIPKAAKEIGLNFEDLVIRILELAIKKEKKCKTIK